MQIQPQRTPTKEAKTADELTYNELARVSAGSYKAFNFGDIKGESTDKDHKDWVMI